MLRKWAFSFKLFDPLFLKGKGGYIEVLRTIADELFNFDYAQFDDNFIEDMKKEILLAVEHANREFNWDDIKPTVKYKTRIYRNIKRMQLQNDDELDSKYDTGERACHIWEWWRMRIMHNERFNFFRKVLILVVLSQVSSYSVERLFLQLNLMRDTCGDSMLEDMV